MSALLNQRTIKTHVCAQCFGELVEKFIDGEFAVVCPKGCQPGGFVAREYAARRKSESIEELYDVYHNLPQLKPAQKIDTKALFQEDF